MSENYTILFLDDGNETEIKFVHTEKSPQERLQQFKFYRNKEPRILGFRQVNKILLNRYKNIIQEYKNPENAHKPGIYWLNPTAELLNFIFNNSERWEEYTSQEYQRKFSSNIRMSSEIECYLQSPFISEQENWVYLTSILLGYEVKHIGTLEQCLFECLATTKIKEQLSAIKEEYPEIANRKIKEWKRNNILAQETEKFLLKYGFWAIDGFGGHKITWNPKKISQYYQKLEKGEKTFAAWMF
jgi:hypothetical protein